MPPLVYLARHGQTAYNAEGRFQGQQEIPLDDTGRAQAAELAERAAGYGFAALWCSPLLRARETADLVAARIGLTPREDARLMETDSGDWTDRSFAGVIAEGPDAFDAFATPALRDVESGGLPALVVCHGMVIRAALAVRAGELLEHIKRVPNAALVPLDPTAAEHAELGGGATTLAS